MKALSIQSRLQLAKQIHPLCEQAGAKIAELHNSTVPIAVQHKADQSPVTEADRLAHRLIVDGLHALTPDYPVLSEEQQSPGFEQRRQWARYWLVDPLDGTREFIDRNGEFTINIALIENGFPVLGMIYLPLERLAYIGVENAGAWRVDATGRQPITTAAVDPGAELRVFTSSRHCNAELLSCLDKLAQHFAPVQWLKVGSALKFCRLAEGRGDFYPRFSPCCEWDTAAGQAILEAAGGQLLDTNFNRLAYNQGPSLINPNFYAIAAANIDWKAVLE
jgi:3'(2'), 5'-bisphosphate nucleotidase